MALASVAVALQISYPLLSGAARDRVTVAVVVVFAAANVSHAAVSSGAAFATVMVALTAGSGFVVEQIGIHSGLPFGSYSYGSGLGPTWSGVPPLVALAWVMLAWPAAIAARVLVRGRWQRVLVGAWALAATDLFLDPQMVHTGYWAWVNRSPHLPGVPTVPLSNYAGWLLVALALSAVLQWLLDAHDRRRDGPVGGALALGRRDPDTLPILLYCWLCVGWIVSLAIFLDLPAAAGWGALATAPVVVGLVARIRNGDA